MGKLILQGQRSDQLTFRELYLSINRREFIRHVAAITKRSESTIYNWTSGKFIPDALAQSMLEKEFGIPASVLFPKKEVERCAQ